MSLYDTITLLQDSQPWGTVLDAGTGPGSMRWLLSQPTERWTAVTAAPAMAEKVSHLASERQRGNDRIVDVHRIGIRYGERSINSQLDLCAQALEHLPDRALAIALHERVATLRAEALSLHGRLGGLRQGHDYILVAEPT